MPADTPLTPIKKLFNESWYHFVQLKVEALYDVAWASQGEEIKFPFSEGTSKAFPEPRATARCSKRRQ